MGGIRFRVACLQGLVCCGSRECLKIKKDPGPSTLAYTPTDVQSAEADALRRISQFFPVNESTSPKCRVRSRSFFPVEIP